MAVNSEPRRDCAKNPLLRQEGSEQELVPLLPFVRMVQKAAPAASAFRTVRICRSDRTDIRSYSVNKMLPDNDEVAQHAGSLPTFLQWTSHTEQYQPEC